MAELKHYLSIKFQKPYTRDKIITLITDGVLYLAKIHSIPNHEKKPLLLKTIKELIDETDLPDYSKRLLCDLVDNIGDTLIESLIKLGKDTISFVKSKCCYK